ncbi:MAG: hypothetical protein EOO77_13670 [Oxalobacteraceae bacterium]|nr:MAG: hypothetical protein EOO77_13670 [Oxalobacteraceae bacterium]
MSPTKMDVDPIFMEAIENLPDGISIFDADGVPILHNTASEKRFPHLYEAFAKGARTYGEALEHHMRVVLPDATPEEVAQEQQLRILEARAGNTSFGDGNGKAFRQLDKNSGGFTVRKFKALPGQDNKRGEGHQAPGIDPKGEPLKAKRKRSFF